MSSLTLNKPKITKKKRDPKNKRLTFGANQMKIKVTSPVKNNKLVEEQGSDNDTLP